MSGLCQFETVPCSQSLLPEFLSCNQICDLFCFAAVSVDFVPVLSGIVTVLEIFMYVSKSDGLCGVSVRVPFRAFQLPAFLFNVCPLCELSMT